MMDTKVGSGEKMKAADVAKVGFDAMMNGKLEVVAGFANKLRAPMSHVAPDAALHNASRHGRAGYGSGEVPKSARERTDRPRA